MSWDDFVPESRHAIFEISDQLDTATDAYTEALNGEAEASRAYKRAWSIAFLKDDKVAATLRNKWAEAHCTEEDAALTFATARVKACKAKCDLLNSQLMVQQSALKYLGRVT